MKFLYRMTCRDSKLASHFVRKLGLISAIFSSICLLSRPAHLTHEVSSQDGLPTMAGLGNRITWVVYCNHSIFIGHSDFRIEEVFPKATCKWDSGCGLHPV